MRDTMKILLLTSLLFASISHAQIKKGDTIDLKIKGVPVEDQVTINGSYMVNSSGRLRLPYLKAFTITDKKKESIRKYIESAYKDAQIYKNPIITVEFRTPTENRHYITKHFLYFSVSDEVEKPGQQRYKKSSRIIDAVNTAIPTSSAALNRVELLRNAKLYRFNMKNPTHARELVYPNDQIILRQKSSLCK